MCHRPPRMAPGPETPDRPRIGGPASPVSQQGRAYQRTTMLNWRATGVDAAISSRIRPTKASPVGGGSRGDGRSISSRVGQQIRFVRALFRKTSPDMPYDACNQPFW